MYIGMGGMRRRYGGFRGYAGGLGKAVDVLMANGEWMRDRIEAQDVTNGIATGGDLYEAGGGMKKLTLVFYNSKSDPNVSKYNPDVWNVVVPGGTGPQSSIPLRDYLAGAGPGAVIPTTLPIAPIPSVPTDIVSPGTTITEIEMGTIPRNTDGGTEVDPGGVQHQQPQTASMPLLFGIGLLAFLALRRK